jgi:hypothetical protein
MAKVNELANELQQLNRDELAEFRDWFWKYDSDEWDKEIERTFRLANSISWQMRQLQSIRLWGWRTSLNNSIDEWLIGLGLD